MALARIVMQLNKYKRIMIIGSCGAGKSYLSTKLARNINYPLIHLDKEFWQPDWVEPDKPEWLKKVQEIVAEDKWIIDGNYGGSLGIRMQRADLIVILDRSKYICLFRIIKRVIKSYGRTRVDMGEGCRERFDLDFMKYVWNFPEEKRVRIDNELDKLETKPDIIYLKSNKQVNDFLKQSV